MNETPVTSGQFSKRIATILRARETHKSQTPNSRTALHSSKSSTCMVGMYELYTWHMPNLLAITLAYSAPQPRDV